MDEDFEYESFSYPWSWRSSGVAIGQFVSDVLNAAASLAGHLTQQLAADHNYHVERDAFLHDAALEIETITGEE